MAIAAALCAALTGVPPLPAISVTSGPSLILGPDGAFYWWGELFEPPWSSDQLLFRVDPSGVSTQLVAGPRFRGRAALIRPGEQRGTFWWSSDCPAEEPVHIDDSPPCRSLVLADAEGRVLRFLPERPPIDDGSGFGGYTGGRAYSAQVLFQVQWTQPRSYPAGEHPERRLTLEVWSGTPVPWSARVDASSRAAASAWKQVASASVLVPSQGKDHLPLVTAHGRDLVIVDGSATPSWIRWFDHQRPDETADFESAVELPEIELTALRTERFEEHIRPAIGPPASDEQEPLGLGTMEVASDGSLVLGVYRNHRHHDGPGSAWVVWLPADEGPARVLTEIDRAWPVFAVDSDDTVVVSHLDGFDFFRRDGTRVRVDYDEERLWRQSEVGAWEQLAQSLHDCSRIDDWIELFPLKDFREAAACLAAAGPDVLEKLTDEIWATVGRTLCEVHGQEAADELARRRDARHGEARRLLDQELARCTAGLP